MDQKAGLWATLSPEERSMLEGELAAVGHLQTHRQGKLQKFSRLAFPILACVVVLLLFSDKELWKQALSAGKKLGSEVGSLAGAVRREVGDFTGSRATAASPRLPGPIELVSQSLRKNGLPITAGNLRMKDNPAGEGTIVYSPHYFGPNRRLAWIVIDGHAYSLTAASGEATPSLRTSYGVPSSLWKKTGLSHEKALSQLQNSLWD
ncbi:MAG: hypothetical protein ACE15E_10215 [Acidobacteriota bacterium]